ncbi:MAG: ATPase domain-containing protein [Myxococcota bacterium]
MEAVATGIDLFDSGPAGFQRSQSHLGFGASGTGKSVLGLQFAYAGLQAGETVLYVCREKAEELLALGKSLGLSLEEYVDDERLVLLEYEDQIGEIVAERGVAAVMEELRGETDPSAVRRVILDPVDPFLSACSQEADFRDQLRAISTGFGELGWTSLLLASDAVAHKPFSLRLFSEVCWTVFQLLREVGDKEQTTRWMHLHRMGDAELTHHPLEFCIEAGGVRQIPPPAPEPTPRPFARFRLVAAPGATVPILDRREAPPSAVATIPNRQEATPSATSLVLSRAADVEGPVLSEARVTRRVTGSKQSSRVLVLVVDDNAKIRSEVTRVMDQVAETLDVSVRIAEAADGLQALRSAAAAKPDLLITSIAMPRLDGIGLCRLLREHKVDVPILFLSSRRSSGGERLRCLMVGGDQIVGKPFEPNELAARAVQLLRARRPGSVTWPEIDLKKARSKLGPRRIQPDRLEAHIAVGTKFARKAKVGLYLVGYEFRFIDGNAGSAFVDRFYEGLCQRIRDEDAVCALPGPRIVVMIVDADEDIVRSALNRVHSRMVLEAEGCVEGRHRVKPKALYRMLALSSSTEACDVAVDGCIESLFAQPPRLIEEDLAGRAGQPMEKYPLLEAVYAALTRGDDEWVSPKDGSRHDVTYDQGTGVRTLVVDEYRYRTQSLSEDSPAGFRASRGAAIVWVEEGPDSAQPVARIEDGRVFRDADL